MPGATRIAPCGARRGINRPPYGVQSGWAGRLGGSLALQFAAATGTRFAAGRGHGVCRIGWVRWLSGGIAGVGVPVVRALRASSILVSVITVVAGVLMVVGLALSARPEIAGGLGFALTSRDGLALALGSGAVAIASALLGRVLALLAVSE